MSSKGVLALMALPCVLAIGCGGGSQQSAPPATTAAAAPAAPAGGMAVAAGDFGVAECDAFMKKYVACIDSKVPEAARGPMKQALDQQKAAWQQAASTAEGKAALAKGCTDAEAAAKTSTASYGCEW